MWYANQGQELADIFKFYIGHYADALPRTLPGMVELLADLKAHGYGVWGLTNWSHETFHLAFEKYPRLEQLLQGTVVSGVEKMHKPNADIYELALTRFGLTAERCVFFDDTAKNIVGAQRGRHPRHPLRERVAGTRIARRTRRTSVSRQTLHRGS